MSRIFFTLLLGILMAGLQAQDMFTHVYGGPNDERAIAVVQTQDLEYVLVGYTYSFGAGKSDIWILKVDANGQERWRKFMGGPEADFAHDLVETRDGNYLVVGSTHDQTNGDRNAWIFQLNRYGELMWSRTYGGEDADEAKAATQTLDGGFAVAGYTESNAKGSSDIWVLRLNAVGDILWEKNYGGTGKEKAHVIIETLDEGLLIGGYQHYSNTRKADMLLVKIDRHGKGIWRRPFRAKGNGVIEDVLETPDGEIMAAGWAYNEVSRDLDAQLLKVSAGGKLIWEQSYGEDGKDAVYEIVSAPDGFLLTGQTAAGTRSANLWLFQVDPAGRLNWQKRTSGAKSDYGHAMSATHDGGYIIAGGTKSFSQGGSDMCLFKTDARGNFAPGPIPYEGMLAENQPQTAPETEEYFKPNLYILAVGVSEFTDPTVKLTFAHSDADAIARRFAQLKGSLFREVQVKTLLNERATLTNIKRGISWLEREATHKDMILVFISSHGALDNKGSLYILPTDFDAHNLFATALNIRDLTEGMNGTPCKKLIFLDACHSGQSGYDLLEFASIKAQNLNQAVEELVGREAGVTVMTSSSGTEFSYENPRWGHGAFTKALLEGLGGSADYNDDRIINLMELNLYVMERVKDLTNGRQHPYIPINLFGNIPLFVLD